jgi:hypothetical protein
MPVISLIWELEVGGSQLEAGLGNNMGPYLKNKQKKRAVTVT